MWRKIWQIAPRNVKKFWMKHDENVLLDNWFKQKWLGKPQNDDNAVNRKVTELLGKVVKIDI